MSGLANSPVTYSIAYCEFQIHHFQLTIMSLLLSLLSLSKQTCSVFHSRAEKNSAIFSDKHPVLVQAKHQRCHLRKNPDLQHRKRVCSPKETLNFQFTNHKVDSIK